MTDFSDIKGKTIQEIKGLKVGSDEVIFTMTDGSQYLMNHRQD
jgi:hypothetical protein